MIDTQAIRFRNDTKASARLTPEKSSKEVYDNVLSSTLSENDEINANEVVSQDFVCMKSSLQRA